MCSVFVKEFVEHSSSELAKVGHCAGSDPESVKLRLNYLSGVYLPSFARQEYRPKAKGVVEWLQGGKGFGEKESAYM